MFKTSHDSAVCSQFLNMKMAIFSCSYKQAQKESVLWPRAKRGEIIEIFRKDKDQGWREIKRGIRDG